MAGSLMSAGGGRSGGSGRHRLRRQLQSDINVTPFVDVMLVLLIVFMVTAPMMTQGVQVALPEAEAKPLTPPTPPLEISVRGNGDILLQAQQINNLAALQRRVGQIMAQKKEGTTVLIRADRSVDYGRVAQVMAALQQAGIVDVGLVTTPQE